jgi:HTH-type transcriptional regulator/antitoxin HigA
MEGRIMSIAQSTLFTPKYHRLMRKFPLRQIRTQKDAATASKILESRFRDKFDDRGEEEYILILADLLADYEDESQPTPDTATGLDVLQHLVEENNIRQQELSELLNIRQSAVSMLLNGQRPITAEHARRLGKRFAVNPGLFL